MPPASASDVDFLARPLALADYGCILYTMGNTNYHVTALRGTGLHGHDTSHCDPSGCAGDELYLGDVAALRNEAALAGDREQVALCDVAIESLTGEHDDDVRAARAECARVIQDAAMRDRSDRISELEKASGVAGLVKGAAPR